MHTIWKMRPFYMEEHLNTGEAITLDALNFSNQFFKDLLNTNS